MAIVVTYAMHGYAGAGACYGCDGFDRRCYDLFVYDFEWYDIFG
jgi:hypothetical protein